MGTTGAVGYADAVAEGQCDLAVAIHAHLTTNHWPPHSPRLVPFAVQAVKLAANEEWDAEVPLPEGLSLREKATGQRRDALTVREAVSWLHLEAFAASAVAGHGPPHCERRGEQQ